MADSRPVPNSIEGRRTKATRKTVGLEPSSSSVEGANDVDEDREIAIGVFPGGCLTAHRI